MNFEYACGLVLSLGLSAYLFLNRHESISVVVAVAFILAGGIGNQIDRISNHGLVTDFINLGIGPLRTGVFNVADMAVTFGGIAIALMMLRNQPPEPAGAIASEALSVSHGKPILQDQ